jgi:hypothetical protein
MLAGQLSDAGLQVHFSPPPEKRGGLGPDIVHVLMRIESEVEAGIVGSVSFAVVQRVLKAFKDRHPDVNVEAEQRDEPQD